MVRRGPVVVAAVVAVALPASPTDAKDCEDSKACLERVARKQCSKRRPVPCIRRAALHHGVPTRLQLAIARCESRLRWWAWNPSGASSIMQIMPSTFASTPYADKPIMSVKWNPLAGAWLLKTQGTAPWNASRGCWATGS